jgi:divalent metal cation (Fe/Co/Zn/Cd) transporter
MESARPGPIDVEARAYKRAVLIILSVIGALTLAQSVYALAIGNRFLLKDALDWGYDLVLWAVALACFGRGMRWEHLAALAIGAVMFVAGCHTAYDLWDKIVTGRRPELWVAGWSSGTMVFVALLLLVLMWRFRRAQNALVAATWLSSRNSIVITLLFAGMSLFARTRGAQGYEIALDCLAIFLSFQACWAILRQLKKDRERSRPGGGQGEPERATSPL